VIKVIPLFLYMILRRRSTPDVVNDLIDYFVGLEEYELCAELKNILDKKIIILNLFYLTFFGIFVHNK